MNVNFKEKVGGRCLVGQDADMGGVGVQRATMFQGRAEKKTFGSSAYSQGDNGASVLVRDNDGPETRVEFGTPCAASVIDGGGGAHT